MKKYRIGFDIGGVITTHTTLMRDIMEILRETSRVELYVVTDMAYRKAKELLAKNNFKVADSHILSVDWSLCESRCKEEVCKEYGIDLLFDDHMPYLSALTTTVGVLVMPKKGLPYSSDEWQDA